MANHLKIINILKVITSFWLTKPFFIILNTPHYEESWQMDPFYPLTMWWVARLEYMENVAIKQCIESN